MYILWSFDTEDYITPEADDALLAWARLLSRRGVRGSFCLVAEKARKLVERGRKDVLEALEPHEIGYHSAWHSRPPVFPVYLDALGWEDGVAEVRWREEQGIADLAESTGRFPVCDVPPGKAWAPQVVAAMKEMGISISAGAYVCEPDRSPTSYCGALTLRYGMAMETFIDLENPLRAAQERFVALAEHADSDHGVIVPFSHPGMAVTQVFWDAVNFAEGRNPPPEAWRPAPLRPSEQTEFFFRYVDEFLAWLLREPGLEWINYTELLARYPLSRPAEITLDAVLAAAERLERKLLPTDLGEDTLSPAEGLAAMIETYRTADAEGRMPVRVALRSPLGPALPPPEETGAGELSAQDLVPYLEGFAAVLCDDQPMPHELRVGQYTLSPGDLARTLAAGILAWAGRGRIPERLPLLRGPAYPHLPRMEAAWKPFQFRGTWPIFPPDFEGGNVAEMGRRMLWSYRPLKRQG